MLKSLLIPFIFLFISQGYARDKQDSVFMTNGQVMVGEIKIMEKGILDIETEYSKSDFHVEWIYVQGIKSDVDFLLILKDESRIKGKISTDPMSDQHIIIYPTNGSKMFAKTKDIVYLKSVENGFLDRMKGDIGGGMNLTQASNTQQYSLNSTVSYAYTHLSSTAYINFIKNNTQDTIQSERANYGTNWRVFVNKKWFILGAGDFLRSDEQNLNLRTTIQLGYGTYPLRNHKMYLSSTAGVALNSEDFLTEGTTTQTIEAFLEVDYNAFAIKDVTIATKLQYFSTIKERRHRFTYNLDIKFDLPFDFYIGGNMSYNYDSQPSEESSNTDYVIATTVGWKF